MLQLSRYLGFFPSEHIFRNTNLHAGDEHVFSNLSQGTFSALTSLIASTEGPPELLSLRHNERNDLLESIIRYYTMHIDGFSGLKSFVVLQEVFRPVR
jgi:hypothetical protein